MFEIILFCFVKCFIGIQNDQFNQSSWILWPYYDKYGEFIVNGLKKLAPILAWI